MKLNHGQADVVINWSGGLHHAKKAEVHSFPAVNDQEILAHLDTCTRKLFLYTVYASMVSIDNHLLPATRRQDSAM